MRFVWVHVCLCVWAVGCSVGGEDRAGSVRQEVESSRCSEQFLAWGSGDGQVGIIPAGEERLARGAPAVAVAPDGDLFLLDSVNGRVLELDRLGGAHPFAEVPLDAESIAVGPDGAVAIFSPFRAVVWVFGPDGATVGEMSIPRALRNLGGVSLGQSRRVQVHNAYQDTFAVGSASLPHDVHAILRGKSEGAYLLADGRGVKGRALGDGVAEMIVVRNDFDAEDERHAEQRFAVPMRADSLQVAGVAGRAACFRVETVDRNATKVMVDRHLLCMDVDSGRVLFETALPAPGLYVPRQEIAVGGAPPTAVWHHPEPTGLRVEKCEVLP